MALAGNGEGTGVGQTSAGLTASGWAATNAGSPASEDGKQFKSLKPHLATYHGLTPDKYSAKWGHLTGNALHANPLASDKRRYRCRNRIEIMLGRLKDWRRVATRYDRCPTVFFSAIAPAATVVF